MEFHFWNFHVEEFKNCLKGKRLVRSSIGTEIQTSRCVVFESLSRGFALKIVQWFP